MISLSTDSARCIISAADGGRIASLRVGEQRVLYEGPNADPMQWGSYPMAPWAGRVRDGQFHMCDVKHQLAINMAPHAIHGTVFTQPWHTIDFTPRSVSMTCDLGPMWPFGGQAHQHFELGEDSLSCTLAVTAADLAMPAELGWHPWFTKPVTDQLGFSAMYERDETGIPSGRIVDPKPRPWDDCFTGPTVPLRLHYPTCTVTVSSDCDHWIVFDEPSHATCVEPQSGPPDRFNFDQQILQPGQTLTRTMLIEWQLVPM